MKINLLAIIAAFTLSAYASSQSGNFRVVEKGTENVITSIHMKPGEFIRLCSQGKAGANGDRWVEVAGGWDLPVPFKFPMPKNAQCADISYDREIDDTIFVRLTDSEFIAIPILVKYADNIRIAYPELLNSTKGIKFGDTLSFRMVVLTHDSLMPGVYCSDSIMYRMYSEKGEDTLSELVVNGEKRKTGQMIRQCFNNGQDTVRIILKDSTTTGLNYLSFRLGMHGGISEKFMVATNSSVIGRSSLSDRSRFVIIRNGLLHFKPGNTTPVAVKVLTVKGEIVHAGVYNAAESSTKQYSLPTSLPNGYYLLSLSANGESSTYPFMIMR
jgi:hypothetical protein